MEQGDEAGGGKKPENHERPVFANERSLPEVELTQRDRGPGALVNVDRGNLIARSGKNAYGSFRRAQHEPASNKTTHTTAAAAKQVRGRAGSCDSLQDRVRPDTIPTEKISHTQVGTSSTPRRAGQVLRSGRVRQPHRQHSRNHHRSPAGAGCGVCH